MSETLAKQHILVIEDEVKIAELIEKYLYLEGFKTSLIHDGNCALDAVNELNPDLIILDIMLPGTNGIELCSKIRQYSDVPIIMLTARVEEIDHLIGFDVGADDYVTKPFKPKELMARVKAILKRRRMPTNKPSTFTAGNIIVDPSEYKVLVKNEELKLTINEFSLLKILIASPNKVFSRQDLLTMTQGKYFESYERSIDSHIKNLRKKLTQADPDSHYIESIYGVGYKFKI
ncbi:MULTISPECIES: response regulator [Pseudoalteromonas]|uniref:Response regulator n=1 Tax=Pseudoalteromonas gelatinilytica TaxID=1703256 RepID=A0A3A3F7J5_9GAMM|nr:MULTISPECIES: response regulator [Pseudoalteromonas]RJF37432.1 response regulator [Pseudoalteromonas profundi]RZF82085.1 response regulator [Pseudoalteromonas sp. CO109Y]TMO37463.1 two-component system response regulator BaeR [Pseudoalteromonas sp. S4491]TMO41816.1 two-component system response regulator BaeR [Pseudoalteromonas sp. S4488]GGE81483.1 DNA-binding response regulator [Pseudoalteromonas profundi]